jgi:hypothetical protein
MEMAGRLTPMWCETGNFNEDASYARRQRLLSQNFKKKARPLVEQWLDDLWRSNVSLDIDTFIARLDDPKCRWVFSNPELIRTNLREKLQDVVKI